MKRKWFSGLLALIMTMGLGFGVLSADVKFTDVKKSDWFYEDVEDAVEKGLVNGKTETLFAPYDNLTYAETVKLAAVMHQKHKTGSVTLRNGSPWYQSYVDYCRENKIILHDYSWNLYTSRAEYMDIFSRALPASELKKINDVPDNAVPDVPASHPLAKGIYKLYRAGIVNGVDAARNCKPDANISRAEVAAILTRMMDKDERVKFNIGAAPAPTPDSPKELKIIKHPEDKNVKPGDQVSFKVVAQGEGLQYQWQRLEGGSFQDLAPNPVLNGIQTSELTARIPIGDEGTTQFRCVVKDKHGKQVISNPARLTAKSDELRITQDLDPAEVTALPGERLQFEIKAEGKGLKYRWIKRDSDDYDFTFPQESGQGTNKLEITLPKHAFGDKYTIQCEVSDDSGKKVLSKVKPVKFESYVRDITFIMHGSKEGVQSKADQLEREGKGYVIRKDLNDGTADGLYIYPVLEFTGQRDEAITDLFGKAYKPSDIMIEWADLEHYGKSRFYKSEGNLNEHVDAKRVYLYKTYDEGGSRHPLVFLDVLILDTKLETFNYDGDEVMKFQNSSENANLNEGANPGSYIYFLMRRK